MNVSTSKCNMNVSTSKCNLSIIYIKLSLPNDVRTYYMSNVTITVLVFQQNIQYCSFFFKENDQSEHILFSTGNRITSFM